MVDRRAKIFGVLTTGPPAALSTLPPASFLPTQYYHPPHSAKPHIPFPHHRSCTAAIIPESLPQLSTRRAQDNCLSALSWMTSHIHTHVFEAEAGEGWKSTNRCVGATPRHSSNCRLVQPCLNPYTDDGKPHHLQTSQLLLPWIQLPSRK